MAVRVEVTSTDAEGINVDVFKGDTRVKQLRKSYDSVSCFSGLLSKWHKGVKLPSIPNPNGWFGSSREDTKKGMQAYFDSVVQQVGEESFAINSYFRLYDCSGKVIIITGASSGIGKQNAYQLAEMGAHLILACRSEAKTLPIIADIKKTSGNENIEFMALELLSLKSVNDFVEAFKAKNLPLHVLINNAGAIIEGITDYGVDNTFAACHVGPFLLTMGLMDILKRTENSRILFVASTIAGSAKGLPMERIRSKIPLGMTNATEAYSYAKLANVAITRTLAQKIKEEGGGAGSLPLVVSLHPGAVATDVWRILPSAMASFIKKFLLLEEEGSYMTLYLTLAQGIEGSNGSYFDYMKGVTPPKPFPLAEDATIQQLCWDETNKMCGLTQ